MTKIGYKQTKEHKEKSASSCKGLHRSEITKKKMSESSKGEKNPMFGKHFSEKHKKKISKASIGRVSGMKGKHHSKESKEKIKLGNKGRIVSIKVRKKISKAKKGKKRWWSSPTEFKKGSKGSKCLAWKGGISIENQLARGSLEMKNWRKKVFGRDNYTCRKTGIRGGRLCSHHIKNFSKYPELRYELENGITLSEKVHDEFHEIYGKRNNTKEQLIKFLVQFKD